MVCPSFWEDYYMLIYTHCWELMNSVGSHGSLSLLFMMKVMVCHFVSDSHEVMTALIVVLPSIVVVEISLQLHQCSFSNIQTTSFHICPRFSKKSKNQPYNHAFFVGSFMKTTVLFKVFERIGTDGSLILILLGQRTRTSDSL
jgi:hypothetical protein